MLNEIEFARYAEGNNKLLHLVSQERGRLVDFACDLPAVCFISYLFSLFLDSRKRNLFQRYVLARRFSCLWKFICRDKRSCFRQAFFHCTCTWPITPEYLFTYDGQRWLRVWVCVATKEEHVREQCSVYSIRSVLDDASIKRCYFILILDKRFIPLLYILL